MNVAEESLAADSSPAAGSASKTEPTPSPALGRGLPSVNRVRSLQQRASRVLALGLAALIGMALLGWYYTHAFRHSAAEPTRVALRGANSDVALPPLDGIASALAKARAPGHDPLAGEGGSASSYVIGSVVGDPPPLGTLDRSESYDSGGGMGSTGAPPATPPVDRRLTGSVFVGGNGTALPLNSAGVNAEGAAVAEASIGAAAETTAPSAASFSQQIRTPLTPAVLARRLPTLRFLLPRGAFIDCTLETAVDSSLPGLATCLTATDTFGADGHVVLLERGTRLVGETRGEVRAGSARVYIVWTEARTPTGVVAELDSPATDAMGRAGVSGVVDRHFWDRFGAAMLLSMIDGAVHSAASHQSGGTTVVTGGTATTEILGEVLKSTVNIPPTVTIAAGTRVQALVARDIDFRRVYELRDLTAGP